MKRIFLTVGLFGLFCLPVSADGGAGDSPGAPLLPVAYDPDSGFRLDYSDYDYILEHSVFMVGRSEHVPAPIPQAETGSRLIYDNKEASRLEGNRVLYDLIGDDQQTMIEDVRDAFLDVPRLIPLERLSRNEQLAYWFNLHNIMVMAEIANRYPITLLDRMWAENCGERESFGCARKFNLNGTMVSASDIRAHVLRNWRDPLVVYGFYLGAVGTPNIRPAAYRGASVYDDLKANAREFVNSVRGTRISKDHILKVSVYYRMMAPAFPDFERDLVDHIRTYAEGEFKDRMHLVDEIRPELNDWHIADLYNGRLVNTTALADSHTRTYPPHVQNLLQGVVERHRRRTPVISIEEMPETAPAKAPDPEIAVAPKR